MRLSVAGIFAKCPACEGDDFDPIIKVSSETRNVFVCAGCNKPAHYDELMLQIGEEAVRRARVTREGARRAQQRSL
jgi:hypothetical protein